MTPYTYRGYEMNVVLHDMGYLCAYVKLPESHPFYGKKYDDIPIDVHGGVTFARELKRSQDIDYAAQFGFTFGFWIGWDYAHAGDFMPVMRYMLTQPAKKHLKKSVLWEEHHWQPFEVIEEAKNVIDQLIILEHGKLRKKRVSKKK